jgi:hypothetical protein
MRMPESTLPTTQSGSAKADSIADGDQIAGILVAPPVPGRALGLFDLLGR